MEITENAKALALGLIKRFEGIRLHAYQDVVGIWTIGWGCTGPGIIQGVVWTQEYADDELDHRVTTFQSQMAAHITQQPSDHEMAAMTSLCYNIGIDHFLSSHLLKHFNAGEKEAAANAFSTWKYAGGKVDAGLVHRRELEATAFSTVDA